MLLLRIHSYLKSFLSYKFLILGTYHADTLYLHQVGCEDSWFRYSKPKRSAKKRSLGNTGLYDIYFRVFARISHSLVLKFTSVFLPSSVLALANAGADYELYPYVICRAK